MKPASFQAVCKSPIPNAPHSLVQGYPSYLIDTGSHSASHVQLPGLQCQWELLLLCALTGSLRLAMQSAFFVACLEGPFLCLQLCCCVD